MKPSPDLIRSARRFVIVLLASVLLVPTAFAVTMYKWVDDTGATHVSDKVPEKYKASAKAIESRSFESNVPDKRPAHVEPAQKGPVQYQVHQVCPNYQEAMVAAVSPRVLKDQRITEGRYLVEFTVTVEGKVENVVVKEASHDNFARAGQEFARLLRCSPQEAPRRVSFPFGYHDRS